MLHNVQVYCAMPKWVAQLSRCVAKVPNPVKLHFSQCCAICRSVAQCPSVLHNAKVGCAFVQVCCQGSKSCSHLLKCQTSERQQREQRDHESCTNLKKAPLTGGALFVQLKASVKFSQISGENKVMLSESH